MHFKLIIAFVEDSKTETVMEAARQAGATGATVISNARGEGMKKSKTFLGLSLETQRDVLMFLVKDHLNGDAAQLSLLEAVLGGGTVAGGMILSVWGGFDKKVHTMTLGMLGFAIAFMISGTASIFFNKTYSDAPGTPRQGRSTRRSRRQDATSSSRRPWRSCSPDSTSSTRDRRPHSLTPEARLL